MLRINIACVFLRLAAILITAAVASACSDDRSPTTPDPTAPEQFVGSQVCATCHAEQFDRWQHSHHALAMAHASADTVLGDFNAAEFEYYGIRSRFFLRDDQFYVETDNEAGKLQEYVVRYVFGVSPLQQYLIEFPDGRLQALPIAWDTRAQDEGGQRWFHLYPDEFIGHTDPLHWTGRDQNWNYMCAECHSTKLQKNYELKSDSFATTWSEINVGCEACHGPASRHVALADGGSYGTDNGLVVDLDDSGGASWLMNTTTGIAERSEMRMTPQNQPEACGRCHARRAVIAAEYVYGRPLLDTHRVSVLAENLYFADGQIQDEVYVYGSFLQSRMYRAGVSCSDCHEPHSATLKSDGAVSDVCSTCHLPTVFGATDHHRHESGQVQCVDCHMPSRDYMVIDGRRDHSFRVPRPDLTLATGSPNACDNCHADQGAEWASSALREWYGDTRPSHYATAIHAGRLGSAAANRQLAAAAVNPEYPGIARATALTLLRPPHGASAAQAIQAGLDSGDGMIRVAALGALRGFPPQAQAEWATPLLDDAVRAVRLAAFEILSPLRDSLPAPAIETFRNAEREFVDAQLAIAERPEAIGNLGNLFVESGDAERALQYFRLSLGKEPRNVGVRVNLADLYRQLQQERQAEITLREGLAYDVDHAALRHALGLLLVRAQRHEDALAELQQAAQLDVSNPRYTYVYAIALNSLGQAEEAVAVMQQASARFPADFDIGWSLVTMLRDQGRLAQAQQAATDLVARFPENENARNLLGSLQ
jgi:tetratricopeptide (TPR) repeat protein